MRLSAFKYLLLLLLAAAIILFISVIQSNPDIFPRKVSGSFEYIRKGEDFLDKAKYTEAIKYFEKAYESSPENETIKADLVYVYSTYSNVLAQDNKYDEAVKYFDKSYNITPNSSTLQNLAMIYSEKALYEAQKGDLLKAKNTYLKARGYAAGSDRISRNIGIFLYNDAVSEFKSGREEITILCLKESTHLYKDMRALELLGDMYYKHAELRMARFYWHLAKLLNPKSDILAAKLSRISKEMALIKKERESNLQHFEIRYKENLPIDKELASEILEKAYADVGKDLGYYPSARTKIFFYSKEDFKNIFHMPYFVKAFYDGSIKMPSPETYLEKEEFVHYIYHEYTHAIVSAKTNNNCPSWFSEGIAVWEEYRDDRSRMTNFIGKIASVPEISMQFLDESFKTDEINKNKALCYMLSYTLVDYILSKWGVAGLQGILKRLSTKQHIVNAIDDEFLLSEKEFEQRWRTYAMDKYFNNIIK